MVVFVEFYNNLRGKGNEDNCNCSKSNTPRTHMTNNALKINNLRNTKNKKIIGGMYGMAARV